MITFYSYKGGVGRSFALANIAVLLGKWGFRVLCIDWDIDAPGLNHFFHPHFPRSSFPDDSPTRGLVGLLDSFRKTKEFPLQWNDYITELQSDEVPNLSIIVAGSASKNYSEKLHRLNWKSMYQQGLGNALEVMFEDLRANYDYILVDSRTGITDFSGVITAQLPDVLAFLFTANEQSFIGATDVARRAGIARNNLAIAKSKLLLLPIPARFETQLEHTISTEWKNRFADQLGEFYSGWASSNVLPAALVQATTIPYIPIWSFGERLSAVEEELSDPSSINYSLENIAALLANNFSQTHLLAESRDEFVSAARRRATRKKRNFRSVFISYLHEDEETANVLKTSLVNKGIEVSYVSPDEIKAKSSQQTISATISRAIDQSQHMIVLLSKRSERSQWQNYELQSFRRQAAVDKDPRFLIPILLTKDENQIQLPTYLHQYQTITLNDNIDEAIDQILLTVEASELLPQKEDSILNVQVYSEAGHPIAAVAVAAVAENGTLVEGITDKTGKVSLQLVSSKKYTLLVAHYKYSAQVIDSFETSMLLRVMMRSQPGGGSVIIQGSGRIPGLDGSINPIQDAIKRTYLYAKNISINNSPFQPANFVLKQPLQLEDSRGSLFKIIVEWVLGRVSLINFVNLRV